MLKVLDLEFKSTDHVIEEVENMNVKGGSPFGRAAAWAFKLACEQEQIYSFSALKVKVDDITTKLNNLKPTMSTINNTCKFVQDIVNDPDSEVDLAGAKGKIIKVCDHIIKNSFEAVEKTSVFGAQRISDGDTIMMHSYSSTLMGIFIAAKEAGKNFKVICTESRPLRESRKAIGYFQELGIPVTLITDASVYEFLPQCDYVIMGADSMDVDGSVANKMGTAQIAKLAKACKKDVYIASELYKLDLRTQTGYKIVLERRTKDEIVFEGDYETMDGLEVINQFFDVTPATDIKAIICEFGIINPSQMLSFWSNLEKEILK
ncbi:hypothetical protein P7D63_20560 [Enterococcus raffinosus]|uniref:translation initiation factor eIF-2B n=1 Tax=Enterococcus raffinosus TaxID=71452 RepID=UPI00288D962C|nr:hypothetical protein [Enterococcus raffinosus]MDT2557078.1 hypothetical protein [Enterococcus raffinosus]